MLNQERYAGANILVAGPNFGTGSSREHAVWALMDYGFEAVLSPRFADIFRNNCAKMGLVAATVAPEVVERLLGRARRRPRRRDRRRRRAPARGRPRDRARRAVRARRLHPLAAAERLDDIGLTLRHADAIDAYERTRPAWLPTVT
ncbi:MAG: hypothetical protein KatS3mg009_1568 [Acidimicrobiia bacterium]|nr:MAG: hypothetical protein KatS3mg009_1568 [Acidimicrobiia bacterium]